MPSTGRPLESGSTTYAGSSWLSVPRPYATHAGNVGRPAIVIPVCIAQMACSWFRCSVYIDRTIARSSACRAMCGSVSENSRPDSPCRANRYGLRSKLPVSFSSSATSLGGGWPSYFVSIGLGSNRSTWLGPPCMKSWMTALARAGMWPGRCLTSETPPAAAGASARKLDSPSIAASTIPPNPPPKVDNASRRDNKSGIERCDRVGMVGPRSGSMRVNLRMRTRLS